MNENTFHKKKLKRTTNLTYFILKHNTNTIVLN